MANVPPLLLLLFGPLLNTPATMYAVLFILPSLAEMGLPIPEEVALLLMGYFAYAGITDFSTGLYIMIPAILLSDIVGYVEGRFLGEWIQANVIARSNRATMLMEKTKGYFERYGEKVVVFSRPLFGIRGLVPIFAGHFRMNFFRFMLLDSIAAIPWTIFLMGLSYYIGSSLDLITEIKEIKHLLYFAIICGILVYSAVRYFRGEDADRSPADS
ncbi:MAG: DedA family protein [Candidatus Sungbacteria bacterium]|nr:DedA family protein [Candidatus Sungbacteria bacterium]